MREATGDGWRGAARLLAFLLAAFSIVWAWSFGSKQACIDYYQFWVVGRAVGEGEAGDVYADAERARLGGLYAERALAEAGGAPDPRPTLHFQAARQRRRLETYSSPWLYTLVGTCSTGDYAADQMRFQAASLAAYLLAIAILGALLGAGPAGIALWTALLLQWSGPFVDDVVAGNVNRIQLLTLALVAALAARPGRLRTLLSGALLGASLAAKPNLAPVAPALLLGLFLARGWGSPARLAGGLLAGVALSVAAAAAYFGSLAPWGAWLAQLPALLEPGSPAAGSAVDTNFSLVRLVRDEAGLALEGWAPAVLTALLAWAFLRGRHGCDRPGRVVTWIGAGAALALLSSGLAWQHYFVALVPLAMALLRPRAGGAWKPWLALAGLALVSLSVLGPGTTGMSAVTAAWVTGGGALLLFTLGLCEEAAEHA